MTDDTDDLAGLQELRLEHRELFDAAAEASGRTTWYAYFPWLLFGSRPKLRIAHEVEGEALLIYALRKRGHGHEVTLIFPPLPFTESALRRARQRMDDCNGNKDARIRFVQEDEALAVARAGYAIRLDSSEFVYDRAAVSSLAGPDFKRLRRNLALLNKHEDLVVRPYLPEDKKNCLDLLDAWRTRMAVLGGAPGYGRMSRCLEEAAALPPDLLRGEVVEIAGRPRGFAFGGPISRSYGSVFAVITDLAYAGAPYLLRHRLLGAFPELSYFNDSSDNGRAGLGDIKRRFRPVAMKPLYRARAA